MGGASRVGERTSGIERRMSLTDPMHPAREKDDDDTGAALVEMAMALPLLLMLLFGIISSGMAFDNQLSLTHAAREASRHAATLPVTNFGSMGGWLDAVAQRAIDDSLGTLAPGSPGLYVCVAYVHPDGTTALDSTMRRVNSAGSVSYSASTCFSDGRPNAERRVQVRVARDVDFNALVFQSTLNLDSEAVSRFEAAFGL
jgi:Flp pilus assembly protein TadG